MITLKGELFAGGMIIDLNMVLEEHTQGLNWARDQVLLYLFRVQSCARISSLN